MERIPFEIHDSRGHKVGGLLFLEDEFLVFDLQVRRWGLVKQPPETVKAELKVIERITFEQGFFGDRILVVPRRIELLDAIPGDHKGEVHLKIAKRYRSDAQDFVSEVLRRKRSIHTG